MVLISGAGKTTVVFLSTPSSNRLCRLRSYRASGWAIIVSEAVPTRPQLARKLSQVTSTTLTVVAAQLVDQAVSKPVIDTHATTGPPAATILNLRQLAF